MLTSALEGEVQNRYRRDKLSRKVLRNACDYWVKWMAERVGFEPTCRLPDKTLSRRPRYDHFGTSPSRSICVKRTHDYSLRLA